MEGKQAFGNFVFDEKPDLSLWTTVVIDLSFPDWESVLIKSFTGYKKEACSLQQTQPYSFWKQMEMLSGFVSLAVQNSNATLNNIDVLRTEMLHNFSLQLSSEPSKLLRKPCQIDKGAQKVIPGFCLLLMSNNVHIGNR